MSAELAFMSAVELAQAIRQKKVSSLEATQNFFQRIDRLDPQLNSYLTLCRDQALADARIADEAVQRGSELGPLHGVPISIKDLEMTKGVTTTMGSAVFRDRVPDLDSIVVERVKASGAIILGKTNTPEFGQSGTTENMLGDPTRYIAVVRRAGVACRGFAAKLIRPRICEQGLVPLDLTGIH